MVESTEKVELSITRVCALGSTGAGKSSLCNALSGTLDLFVDNSCTYLARQERVQWFDKSEDKLFIVDTCGFGDSEGRDEAQLKQLTESLRGFVYVNQFLVVLNSQAPRFDKQLQDMLKAFKEVFGEEIFKHFAIVYSRWGYDKKSIQDRKKKNISRDQRTREINSTIKEKIGFDTDKFPVPCFFVDSTDFADQDNIEENKINGLSEEFMKIKQLCVSSEKFLCESMGEYVSVETKLKEEKEKLANIRRENQKFEEQLKQQSLEMHDKVIGVSRKECQERYERNLALRSKIRDYFDNRGQMGGESLMRDIQQILNTFDRDDAHGTRFSKSNFETELLKFLNANILIKVEERVKVMIEFEIQEFAKSYQEMIGEILPVEDFIKKLDTSNLTKKALAASSVVVLGSLGLYTTAAVFHTLVIAGGSLPLFGVLAPMLLLGAYVIYARQFKWSRKEVIKNLTSVATDKIAKDPKLKEFLFEIAEGSLDAAADDMINVAYRTILNNITKTKLL